ncbi:uncharacterized protein LOC134777307 [Penaeus indicus]|uniref:uncharacterized protein LOC134777307 n=1 Tax=Penaeus indicus TaxID=29960 RepID=UPI00300D2B98
MGGTDGRQWWLWAALVGWLWAPAWAVPHPVIVELREKPVEPSPALRSQLRHMTHLNAMLSIDSALCPNSIAAVDAADQRNRTDKFIRAVFRGPPPPHDLSIIVKIDGNGIKAVVQGIPTHGHAQNPWQLMIMHICCVAMITHRYLYGHDQGRDGRQG